LFVFYSIVPLSVTLRKKCARRSATVEARCTSQLKGTHHH
jgi:hypothetical protein